VSLIIIQGRAFDSGRILRVEANGSDTVATVFLDTGGSGGVISFTINGSLLEALAELDSSRVNMRGGVT
jgi:hypothetical protein